MNMITRRLALGIVSMSVASFALGGSAMAADDGTPQPGGTLTMALHADVNSLDPANATGLAALYLANILYDPLVTLAEDGSLQPGLATSWTTPDATTIKLKLRDDVVFHDGTPFNAEAVKFNLDRFKAGRLGRFLRAIDSVAVDGEFEVTIKLKQEDPAVLPTLYELARQAGAMASPTAVQKEGDSFGLNPVGTGPYTFVSWTRDQEMVFNKNTKYWGDKGPYVDKLVLRPIPDEATRTNQLRSGDLDIIYQVQPKDLLLLQRAADIKVVERPSNGWDVVLFNDQASILKNPDVRRALSLAVNRQEITDGLFMGSGSPGQGPIAPSHPGYRKDFYSIPAQGNIEEAKALLAKAGVKEGTKIRLGTPQIPRFEQIAQLVQQDWRKIGIDATIERFETSVGLEQLATGNFEAVAWYYTGHPDLDGVTSNLFDSKGVNNNWTNYKNPEVDDLLRKGRTEADMSRRVGYYQKAEELIMADSAICVVHYYDEIYAYRSNVHGLAVRSDSILNLRGVWKSQ